MSGPIKINIDRPHGTFGPHVDIITPLPNIGGVDKMRIGPNGYILTEDILIKGAFKKNIFDNTR